MPAVLEQLSTSDVPAGERIPFWNEIAQRMLAPVTVEAPDGASFSAACRRIQLRHFEMLYLSSTAARIAGQSSRPVTSLNLQIQRVGVCKTVCGNRHGTVMAGDFVLFDPKEFIVTEFSEYTEALIVRLPVVEAQARIPRLRELAGKVINGRKGPGALFTRLMLDAWDELQKAPGSWSESLNDAIWPLLEMAYTSDIDDIRHIRSRNERYEALFSVIEDNICDPELDAGTIARSLGISTRHVQKLFSHMAIKPTAYIQDRRLELAGLRLRREGTSCFITDVAFDVGFTDLSSFSRMFRRKFNMAPRDYRAGKAVVRAGPAGR